MGWKLTRDQHITPERFDDSLLWTWQINFLAPNSAARYTRAASGGEKTWRQKIWIIRTKWLRCRFL